MIRRVAAGVVILAAAAGVAHASRRIEAAVAARSEGAQVLYLPSGRYLKAASLGFPELMADLVYIWSIQYYGHYEAGDRFRYLEHIYGSVISELDPRYVDPYLIGSMIMSMEANDPEMALRLLDKGIAANPKEWILAFEAGFVCFHTLHDHARAAGYFQKAIDVPGSPAVIRRMHAEMYNKMGDRRTSLRHWQEVMELGENAYVRDTASAHIHDLAIEIDLEDLRAAIAAFREHAGAFPPDLDALVRAGLMARVPRDPEGLAYAYDPVTGEPSSRSRYRLYRRSGA